VSIHAMNGSEMPNGPGLFGVTSEDETGNRQTFVTNIRRLAGNERTPGSAVIAAATWLLVLLDAGLLYVSFDAQYRYIFSVKDARVPSIIEAAMLDAGMVILSALGIGLALRGKASKAERFLIMVCAAASAGMNFAAANPGSWRSVVAYTAAPVFLAIITDRVISVIRRHVLPLDTESAWTWLGQFTVTCLKLSGIVVLYGLRTMLAPKSTFSGLRRMVLDAAPVPGIIELEPVDTEPALPAPAEAPAMPAASCHVWVPSTGEACGNSQPCPEHPLRCLASGPHQFLTSMGELADCPDHEGQEDVPALPEFPTKKAAFLSLYRGHPAYGVREQASPAAAEIAPKAGLQPGTGRTYIIEELRRLERLADVTSENGE
jgi:hypothetical protein